jgi:hypothetical protein
MSLRTSCPSCREWFLLPETAAGRRIRCTECGQRFIVSDSAEALPVLEEADNDRVRTRSAAQGAAPSRHGEPDDDDGPGRQPHRRPQKNNVPLLIGLSLAGGVVIIAGVAGLAFWSRTTRDRSRPPVAIWNAAPPPPVFVQPPDPGWNNPAVEQKGPLEAFPGGPPGMHPQVKTFRGTPPSILMRPLEGRPNSPQAEGPEPPLPPFQDAPNPFRAGTQTTLRPLRTLRAPPDAAAQLAFSPKHDLLFLRTDKRDLWVVDGKTGEKLGAQPVVYQFHDMHLAPDESALFAVDSSWSFSYVHRYDLATRTWERRPAPNIGYRVEVVDPLRFLLMGGGGTASVSLNRWEPGGRYVKELAQLGTNILNGDMEYDPHTGRIYLGNYHVSSPEIRVLRVAGNKLQVVGDTGGSQTARAGGGSSVLASDGRRFYFGKLQVEAMNVKNNGPLFPEVILAASRDLAFGENGYYHAQTGVKAGALEFATRVQVVSPDGMSLWAFNPATHALHQYALEGVLDKER